MRKITLLIFISALCLLANAQQSIGQGLEQARKQAARNEFKEAFQTLRDTEAAIYAQERAGGKALPIDHYQVIKERIQLHIRLKNQPRGDEQMARLKETARTAKNDSIDNDLLYTQANYYYAFGKNAEGDAAISQLIAKYNTNKEYAKVNDCYQTLIGIARKAGNTALVARTYDKYILWNDSVKAITAKDELSELKQKYDTSLATIAEKDDSISSRQYIIIALCVLAAILAGALVVGGVVLVRFILLTRKQKKLIDTANEHNELKTQFIRNISEQMQPTLDTLDASLPGVKALHAFSADIQQLSDLESSLAEPYELEVKNVATFCDNLMEKMKDAVKSDVTLAVNAPKFSTRIAPEALEHILLHLLRNAALYTPAGGKISLEYHKRGARVQQFIVSDTGCGIPEEKRESLFKPFAEVKDLTKGNGLGLPICALMATKMNGSLTLDDTYTKGTRFILKLNI